MPTPLPIRVLVKGASTVNWVSWMGGPRSDFTFPRAIEAELAAEGRVSEVRAVTAPSEQARTILKTWEREVLGYSPDVIVLAYGHYETVHLFLPRWLERHAHSLRARPRVVSSFYRRHLLRPVWKILARVQSRLDAMLPPTLLRRRLARVSADLERYVHQVQKVGSPLVLLLELLPPAQRYRTWFPGMAARIEMMNREIQAMVDRIGVPQVRYVPVQEVVDKYAHGSLDEATPDGFHYSPVMHREVGALLAREIADWADTQPHLALDPALRGGR
jgi:hypothetical protein